MLPTTRRVLPALLSFCLLAACKEQHPPPPKEIGQDTARPLPVQTRNPMLDKSVMDMIYFPADFPVLKMTGKLHSQPIARVIYSRPVKDAREIFGTVVKYGEPWRLGANEATEIEFFRDVTIMDKKVSKGRYILYCIPDQEKWTIVFNSDLYTWGLKINQAKDVYRFDIPVTVINSRYEVFTMKFEEEEKGFGLIMAWDNVYAILSITGIKKGSE